MRYDLTDNMTEEMIGRNHHKEKKKNFHSIGVLVRHAGLEEPAPYLIRGHPEAFEKIGFRLSPE